MTLIKLALPLMLVLTAQLLWAASGNSRRQGITSNFLVSRGHIYFSQADGSLTSLDFTSGKVLARAPGNYTHPTLYNTKEGILVDDYDSVLLIEPATLRSLWTVPAGAGLSYTDEYLVTNDGYGLYQCWRLHDGGLVWKHNYPGAFHSISAGDKVLLLRTFDDYGQPMVRLLNLKTGEMLFTKPSLSTSDEDIYFDGRFIFFNNIPSFSSSPPVITIWDNTGHVITTKEPVTALSSGITFLNDGSKVLFQGKIYSSSSDIEYHSTVDSWDLEQILDIENEAEVSEWKTRLGQLYVIPLTEQLEPAPMFLDSSRRMVVFRHAKGTWRGVLAVHCDPYDPDVVEAVTAKDGTLIIGTNDGRVEALEAKTGLSRWIYLFPPVRHQICGTSGPPRTEDVINDFKEDISFQKDTPLQLLSAVQSSNVTVISDPRPYRPVAVSPLLPIFAWFGIILPIPVLLALNLYGIFYKKEMSVLAILMATGVFIMVIIVALTYDFSLRHFKIALIEFASMLLATLIFIITAYVKQQRVNASIALFLYVMAIIMFFWML